MVASSFPFVHEQAARVRPAYPFSGTVWAWRHRDVEGTQGAGTTMSLS